MNPLPQPLAIAGFASIHPATHGTPPAELRGIDPDGRPLAAWAVDPGHPDLAAWTRHPRLRRCTPLARYLCAAGHAALVRAGLQDHASIAGGRSGMIGVLGTGGIQACSKFYQQVVQEGAHFASPAIFPETVYNSPMSHAAAALGFDGPVDTLVGDESAWPMAMLHAASWLLNGKCDHVLVVTGEELDPIALEAYRRAGWYRIPGFLPGDGAAAIVLRLADDRSTPVIDRVFAPRPYRDRRAALAAARQIFGACPEGPVAAALEGQPLGRAVRAVLGDRHDTADTAVHPFAFATTTAWHLCGLLERPAPQRQSLVLAVGANHQIAAYTLDRTG